MGKNSNFDELIPPWLYRLSESEIEEINRYFWHVCERRLTSLPKNPDSHIFWPRKPMSARCIPEDIHPLDHSSGYDHDVKLEKFFRLHAKNGIIAYHPDALHLGAFSGPYNENMRIWISKYFYTGEICCISRNKKIVLIANHDLNFSVIGAQKSIISDLEAIFGGPEALRQEFVRHVEAGDLAIYGADDQGRAWAWKYLMRWCGWA